jgi:type IV secretory pathway VirJ component
MAEQVPTQFLRDGIWWTQDEGLVYATYQVMQDPDTWTFTGTSDNGTRFAALSADPEKFDTLEIVETTSPQRVQIGTCAVWYTGGGVWGGLDQVRSISSQNLSE